METSAVRQRLTQLIDRAKRSASERRTRNDEGARAYERFLDQIAIPLFRQVAGSLVDEVFLLFLAGGEEKP